MKFLLFVALRSVFFVILLSLKSLAKFSTLFKFWDTCSGMVPPGTVFFNYFNCGTRPGALEHVVTLSECVVKQLYRFFP